MPENNISKPNWIKDALLLFICIIMGVALSGIITFLLQVSGLLPSGISIEKISQEGAFTHLHLNLLISHMGTFILPALAFLYIKRYSGDVYYKPEIKFQGAFPLILSMIIILVSMPLVQYSYVLNQSIDLPHWMITLEEQQEKIIEAILSKESIAALIVNLSIIAVLPAIGEELIFRGIIQGILTRALQKPLFAILFSAFIFSAFHLMFQGFIPRMLLGVLLGLVYWISNNLWLPVIAHFFNNGLQVTAYFLYKKGIIESDITDQTSINWTWAIVSLFMTILFCHILLLFFARRYQISWSGLFKKEPEKAQTTNE